MIQHKNVFISERDNTDFIDFCIRAKENGRYITVFYNEGHMSYEGIFDESKNSRTFRIGKSTGVNPILLEINTNFSTGGSGLYANKAAIKSWRYSKGDETEINETLDSSLFELINQSYREDEDGCWSVDHDLLKQTISRALDAVA